MLKVPAGAKVEVPAATRTDSRSGQAVILPQHLLKALVKLGGLLKDLDQVWAIGGNAGEQVLGVSVTADHLAIVTTEKGCEEITARLMQYLPPSPEVSQDQAPVPKDVEKKLERDAAIGGNAYPVFVKGRYAEFRLDGVRVEVYGELRIKVGELEWGDRLEFEPSKVNIVGASLPIFPLRLKSELYLGLGWIDRVQGISEAVKRSKSGQ